MPVDFQNSIREQLLRETQDELLNQILPWWMNHMVDIRRGGFFGRIDGNNKLHKDAPKSVILNTRILWTFSAAGRIFSNSAYLEMASRACQYVKEFFVDSVYGGVYWMLDSQGSPMETKKQIYAQAFAIYALAEYHRLNNEEGAKSLAVELFHCIEKYSYDHVNKGYLEALARDWSTLSDVRLSDKDANEAKSMNTHLHVLEAYTNLYRIWPDALLKDRLEELIEVFLVKIIDQQSLHFKLFFSETWENRSTAISYGHDIEGSWLLTEAAHVLQNPAIEKRTRDIALQMAKITASEGLDIDGGLWNELHTGSVRPENEKHWWPQAEAVVGFVNAWQMGNDPTFLHQANSVWGFIKQYVRDHENGEWFFRLDAENQPVREEDKAGPWKCPYHNGRMCIEIFERLSN
ncbi:MAG: AGE family epimerase/isomerase [Cyclobacteriaceae bacterium]|nr:AGE family epimerase/isomerase [Cyclobacteriaceae bacterium]